MHKTSDNSDDKLTMVRLLPSIILFILPSPPSAQAPSCSPEGAFLPPGSPPCCESLQKAADPGSLFKTVALGPSRSCQGGYKPCKSASECCSGICWPGGTCSAALRCFRTQNKEADCTLNPVCARGLQCVSQKVPDYDIGACRSTDEACQNDGQCCSQKCHRKKCVPYAKCQPPCSRTGKKPTKSNPCCPGLYEGLNKLCISDAPPGVR